MSEGFRGHLEESVRHLAARFLEVYQKGSREVTEAKQPMAEFCGVGIHTITRWLYHEGRLPKGDEAIKLMCFLEINGYKVIEFERAPQNCRNFAKLIGFGLITSQEATKMIGYTKISSLYKLLRGDHGTHDDREQKLWDMWKVRKDKLDEAIEKSVEKYRLDFSKQPRQPQLVEKIGITPISSDNHGCPRDGVIDIMQGLLRILDGGVLQDLSNAEWEALRPSSSMILRLSSHLSTLSAKLVRPG